MLLTPGNHLSIKKFKIRTIAVAITYKLINMRICSKASHMDVDEDLGEVDWNGGAAGGGARVAFCDGGTSIINLMISEKKRYVKRHKLNQFCEDKD